MPARLAGPGVPPPSPPAPTVRWGPLIDAVRGVRAVERERGSAGWGGVVLDREVMLDSAAGFAGYGYGMAEAYFADGFRERYASGDGDECKRGSETEEDGVVDVTIPRKEDAAAREQVEGRARFGVAQDMARSTTNSRLRCASSARSVPTEHDPVLAPSEQAESPATLPPPSPAWGNFSATSLSPEAPPAGHAAFGSGGTLRVEDGRPSMQTGPIPLTLSVFTTWPSSRLFFSGGGPSFRSTTSPSPPVPAYLLRPSFRPVALQGRDSVAVLPPRFPFSAFLLSITTYNIPPV
ncbi:hypothetical protein B0H13DRAFT_2277372 [Mycena leptocephala]|nr:hypothetical protein B0H13DRAFT_2277372 [Mycena leptocephala]